MNFLDWSNIVALVAIAGFLWRLTYTLNRDMRKLEMRMTDEMRKLGERVAKIEGALLFSHPRGEK